MRPNKLSTNLTSFPTRSPMNLASSPPSSTTNLKNLTSSDEPEKLEELRRTEQARSQMHKNINKVCREWEGTTLKTNKDVRVALIRISVVLGKDGGALGVINGTAPNPVRLGEMCQQLGSVLGRPSWLPVPDFALKALVTEKQNS
ncbi:hypothetical protein YC2023_115698 [Brassica napus]